MDVARYRFSRALRPFSLVVGVISCGLGVALALGHADGPLWAAALTLLAGLLAQSGVNLINDHTDLGLLPTAGPGVARARRLIRRHYRIGLSLILAALLLSLPLVWHAGWPLLAVVLIGLLGALGYTVEPINYKRRGLGVVLVFWLMGVLMVAGAYVAVTGRWDWIVLWRSLPVAALTSLLLLSNELRDWESDREQGIQTLVVRLGYRRGRQLYLLLLSASLLLPLLLVFQGLLPHGWLMLPALLLLPALVRLSRAAQEQRVQLTPLTGRFMALCGGLYILASLPF